MNFALSAISALFGLDGGKGPSGQHGKHMHVRVGTELLWASDGELCSPISCTYALYQSIANGKNWNRARGAQLQQNSDQQRNGCLPRAKQAQGFGAHSKEIIFSLRCKQFTHGAYPACSAAGLKALVALHVALAALPDGCLGNVPHIHQAQAALKGLLFARAHLLILCLLADSSHL